MTEISVITIGVWIRKAKRGNKQSLNSYGTEIRRREDRKDWKVRAGRRKDRGPRISVVSLSLIGGGEPKLNAHYGQYDTFVSDPPTRQ